MPQALARTVAGVIRRWWLFPIGLALALAGAVAADQVSQPRYASTARVVISSNGATERYWEILADQELAKTFAELATDQATLAEIANRQGISERPDAIRRDVSVRLIPDTRILEVTVERADPNQAAVIANEIASSLGTLGQPLVRAGEPQPVRIISAAIPATQSRSLDRSARLALAGLAGLALAGVTALLLDAADRRVRQPADLRNVRLPPVLAAIPRHRPVAPAALLTGTRESDRRAAEAYRALRTALLAARPADRAATILVTSPNARDGAAGVAANLAAMLTQVGARVALVEGNLRQPALHALFGVANQTGLAYVLQMPEAPVTRYLAATSIPRLMVLPAGETPENPADVLARYGIASIVQRLAAEVDFVIIAGPAVLSVTDSAILAGAVDGTILVAGAGRSTTDELLRSAETLAAAGGQVIGIILNGANGTGRAPLAAPLPTRPVGQPIPVAESPTSAVVQH